MTSAFTGPAAMAGHDRAIESALRRRSQAWLGFTARAWFAIAVAGQLIFVVYILSFYGASAVTGNLTAWNKILPRGHVAGDTIGNVAMVVHVLIAAIVTLGGPLQLVPALRTRLPAFHRFHGRLYLATVVTASVSGLFLVWTRSGNASFLQHLTISINAVLILIAAWYSVRHAMAGKLGAHRRWALRLFLLVSGSWFFRVLLMFWIMVHGGPVGFNPDTFEGPALVAIGVLQYALPLAVLEIYFGAQRSSRVAVRLTVAGLVLVLTAAMAVGIGVASMAFWLPNI